MLLFASFAKFTIFANVDRLYNVVLSFIVQLMIFVSGS